MRNAIGISEKRLATRQAPVPGFKLSPRETVSLDVVALLAAAGIKDFSGTVNLQFSYKGNAGALLIATGSFDQTGSYVFDVSAKGIKKDRGKAISYWEYQNGTDSMFTLWNPDSNPQDLLVTLYFHKGSYKVPIHLEPHGTSLFNTSELALSQKPDVDGHVLPLHAKEGSALITNLVDRRLQVNLVASFGTFNIEVATCGEDLCIHCDDIIALTIFPPFDPFDLLINTGAQATSRVTYTDNSTMDYTDYTPWHSDNTSIATVSSSGYTSGINIGVVTIDGVFPVTLHGAECFVTGICDDATVGDFVQAKVQVPTSLGGPTMEGKVTYVNQQLHSCDGTTDVPGYSTFYGYKNCADYQMLDQDGQPIHATRLFSEVVTIQARSVPGTPNQGPGSTDSNGTLKDFLAFGNNTSSPVSGDFIVSRQVISTFLNGQTTPIRVNCLSMEYDNVTVYDHTGDGPGVTCTRGH